MSDHRRMLAVALATLPIWLLTVSVGAGPKDEVIKKCLENLASLPSPDDVAPQGEYQVDQDPCWRETGKYYASDADVNAQAQFLHGVRKLRDTYGVTGAPITVGLWDGGSALSSHALFGSRVTLKNAPSEVVAGQKRDVCIKLHPTHVAGTIGAALGIKKELEGMASGAKILSYTFDNDMAELEDALGKQKVTVTNHSYGVPRGWQPRQVTSDCSWVWWGGDDHDEDPSFGFYDKRAEEYDDLVWRNPQASVFVAAGNERGWTGNPEAQGDVQYCTPSKDGKTWLVNKLSKKRRLPDSRKGGYDTIVGFALAKNVITLGAMIDLGDEEKNPKKVWEAKDLALTDFSSYGPADDGRIKPDLIANGELLSSTAPPERCDPRKGIGQCCQLADIADSEHNGGWEDSGTSMASPVAAGIGALLDELSLNKRKKQLNAAEMKAVLIHTALAKSVVDGLEAPAYDAGWGMIRALAAGNVVAGEDGLLGDITVKKGRHVSLPLQWSEETDKARVTLVWLDPPAKAPSVATVDDRTAMLVDKLSATLLSPKKETLYPWSLRPGDPAAAAVRDRPNTVDNVLRIDVPANAKSDGVWQLELDGTGLKSDEVTVAVAYKGLRPKSP